MVSFKSYNPVVVFLFLIICALLPMFSLNPVIIGCSVLFSVSFHALTAHKNTKSLYAFAALTFVAVSVINPLFSHNGRTVLFVLNNNPVTLEALLYGVCAAAALVSAIFWFAAFSELMSADKVMYIFGTFSPRLALLISMVLRFIPMITRKAAQTADAQKVLGLYTDTDSAKRLKNRVMLSSSLVTWTLENGITTADSMDARGYGVCKRSRFALYRFEKRDAIFSAFALLLSAGYAASLPFRKAVFGFYPDITPLPLDSSSVISYLSYFIMASLPTLCETGEIIRWKYLLSKI